MPVLTFLTIGNVVLTLVILVALKRMEHRMAALFDDLKAKVLKLTNAADAMDVVLKDVKSKLDAVIANGNLNPTDAADLQAISAGIDTEGDKIIADTLANTPAAPLPLT